MGPEAVIGHGNAVELGAGSLEAALLQRLREPVDIPERIRGVVALDIEGGDGWTLHVDSGKLRLSGGLDPDPDTTIITDAATMAATLDGSLSGIEAFIDGRLQVRGNLALSLRLGSSFRLPERPARHPRAVDVRAAGVRTFYLDAGRARPDRREVGRAGPDRRESGRARGKPVILLHGLGATNASMLTTLWDLARDHRVIAPDLVGFGDSAKPLRNYGAASSPAGSSRFSTSWASSAPASSATPSGAGSR